MGTPAIQPTNAVELEPLPGDQADPRVALNVPPPAQLTPEEAAALGTIPGVDPAKARAMQATVEARQPVGEGPQVLEPLPPDPAQQQPQYHVENVPGASSSTSGSSGVDPKAVKGILAAHERVGKAVEGAIAAGQPQRERDAVAATAVADLAQQRAALSAKAAVDAANERDRIANDNKIARDKLDRDANDYLQAGDKIDSSRVWHRMDTGQKIMFAIGAALSGFAQGLNGRGGNPVLDMLTAAQERDLHAQELGLQAKGRGLQMRESMYGRLVEAGHDTEVARAKTLADSDDAIMKQIAAAQAAAATPTAVEAAQKLSADWQVKQAQDTVALEQAVARHTTTSSTRTTQPMLVDQNGQPVSKDTDTAGQNIPGTRVIDPNVHRRVMSNPAQEKQAREVASNLKAGVGAVREMVALRKKYGTELWDDEARGEMETNQKLFTGAMGQMSGSGTVNAGEYPRFAALAPDLGLHANDVKRLVGGRDPTLLKLQALEKALTKAADRSMSSYGVALDFGGQGGGIVRQVQ